MYINNRDFSLLGFTANVQLVVTHVISIAIVAQFKWVMAISSSSKRVIATILVFLYGHQLAVMATPKPYDHFSSIGKLFAARDDKAKAQSQAESAKQLILSQTQDVLRKERELKQLKSDSLIFQKDSKIQMALSNCLLQLCMFG